MTLGEAADMFLFFKVIHSTEEKTVERIRVAVVGGGAAGMMAAISAAAQGAQVILLEGGGKLGRKILISGNGRCNLTNLDADNPSHYHGGNPRFARRALDRLDQFLVNVADWDAPDGEENAAREWSESLRRDFEIALDDDLDTPRALAALFQMVSVVNRDRTQPAARNHSTN